MDDHSRNDEQNMDKNSNSTRNKTNVKRKKRKYLEKFATYVFDKIENKQIDTVVGREKELQRIMNILCRRNKK